MSFDGDATDTDEALLARFAAGDRLAARVLTMRLTPRVLALAKRMLKDATEAEDVAQEAMVRLWRIAPDWREGGGTGFNLAPPDRQQSLHRPVAQTPPERPGP